MDQHWTHTTPPQQIRFGVSVDRGFRALFKEAGVRRALLVTSTGRQGSAAGEALTSGLGRALVSTFAGAEPHLPATIVQAAVRQAKSDQVDAIVSLGGGSVVDLGKAVSFFMEQEAGLPGASFADRPALVHIAVPTTFTGSPYTPWFAMTDPSARHKGIGGGPTSAPRWVLLDPSVIGDMPADVVAGTGLAALTHAVEAVLSSERSPESEVLAAAAAGRLLGSLPSTLEDPTDENARSSMISGAVLAGRALQNSRPGLVQGLADLLGGRTGIAHGTACALLLTPVLRFCSDFADERMAQLGGAMGTEDPVGAIAELVAATPLPSGLFDCGVGDDDIEAVARMSQSNPFVQSSLRPAGEADAKALLEDAF